MTKILIVDDEAKIRELIIKYAKHEGFETAEAAEWHGSSRTMRKESI